MDVHFWDELIASLDVVDLEWLAARIRCRRESLDQSKIVRKVLISKE